MSGRHRRPEAEALLDVDLAAEIQPGPLLEDVVPYEADLISDEDERPADERRPEPAPEPDDGPPGKVDDDAAPDDEREPDDLPDPATTYVGPSAATVTARESRAAQRQLRKARARRRALIVGAAVLAVVLVVAVVTRVLGGGGGSDTPAKKQAQAAAAEDTLLVQVAGADGSAAASALVGVTPETKRASALLVPSRLLVDVASAGSLPFGEALTVDSPTASADALTDLLGVRVKDRWVLSTAGLAALVDKVGGVQAQVDVDVTTKDAKGNETVVVKAGSQKLGGAAAAAYATFLGENEPEQARLARFNDVLDGVVRQLPAGADAIAADVAALGGGSTSSLSGARLGGLLEGLRTASVADQVRYEVLPVNSIDTGSSIDTYGVESAKAGPLLQKLFPGSLVRDPSGQSVRVLVENGVGTPDMVEKARGKLVEDGYRFVNGGNAATLDSTEPSVVLVADGSDKSQRQGASVAKSLGLPQTSIATNPRGQTVADVIVVLGSDFQP